MSKNATIGLIVIIIIVVIAGIMMMARRSAAPATVETMSEVSDDIFLGDEETSDMDMPASTSPMPSGSPITSTSPGVLSSPVAAGTVKEFTVDGTNFKFAPSTMTVKQGDTVRVTFKSSTGMHDWRIDEFNAGTKVLQAGGQETVEFVASKKGQFEYYCSVGTHRQMGMKGTLIVE